MDALGAVEQQPVNVGRDAQLCQLLAQGLPIRQKDVIPLDFPRRLLLLRRKGIRLRHLYQHVLKPLDHKRHPVIRSAAIQLHHIIRQRSGLPVIGHVMQRKIADHLRACELSGVFLAPLAAHDDTDFPVLTVDQTLQVTHQLQVVHTAKAAIAGNNHVADALFRSGIARFILPGHGLRAAQKAQQMLALVGVGLVILRHGQGLAVLGNSHGLHGLGHLLCGGNALEPAFEFTDASAHVSVSL